MKKFIIITLILISAVTFITCKQNGNADEKAYVESELIREEDSVTALANADSVNEVTEKQDETKQALTNMKEIETTAPAQTTEKDVKNTDRSGEKEARVKRTHLVSKKAEIYFPDTLFDFGFIDEGDSVTHEFKFMNKGDAPLEILDVQVTCGCTIPEYTLESIAPGRINQIEVLYKSAGKFGKQVARIDVYTNSEPSMRSLYLKGVVRADVSGSE